MPDLHRILLTLLACAAIVYLAARFDRDTTCEDMAGAPPQDLPARCLEDAGRPEWPRP